MKIAIRHRILVLAAAALAATAAQQAKQANSAPPALPKTPEQSRSIMMAASDAGRLPWLVEGWRAAYERAKSPILAYAYADAIGLQQDLSFQRLAPQPDDYNPVALYRMLEGAATKTKEPYPLVSMYYLVGEHAELILGPHKDKPVRQTPITIRDPNGNVVHRGMSDVYAEDTRLTRRLAQLYAEMVKRDPNDPYVTYVGAMREADPKARVARLKAAAGRGGMELFTAPLLASLVQAYREAGDVGSARQAEGDLRAYIVSRGKAPTARLFKISHPEIFGRG